MRAMMEGMEISGGTLAEMRRDQKMWRHGFEASSSRGRHAAIFDRESIRFRRDAVFPPCSRSVMKRRAVTSDRSAPLCSELFQLCVAPNKAPEPTPLPVTIRACARLAPGSVVAHL
jgi:hypothetical protein